SHLYDESVLVGPTNLSPPASGCHPNPQPHPLFGDVRRAMEQSQAVQRLACLLFVVLAGGCSSSTPHASPPSSTSVAPGSSTSSNTSTSSSTVFSPVTDSVTGRDRAESATPAAGICAEATGPVGNVRLPASPDNVPDPRCLVIRHDQRLSVTNDTDAPITTTLGTHYKATVPPHQTHTFA